MKTEEHDCNEVASVLEVRYRDGYWYRRRECLACRKRFSTIEVVIPEDLTETPATYARVLRSVGQERGDVLKRLDRLEAKVAKIYPGALRDGGDG